MFYSSFPGSRICCYKYPITFSDKGCRIIFQNFFMKEMPEKEKT